MEKLIHQFEFGLFVSSIDLCWINFLIEKFAWKPILDAVNDREEGIKTLLLKMQERNAKPSG
jgi:F-type H+-transporting ATPase subunit b